MRTEATQRLSDFTPEEYAKRIASVREKMRSANIDVLVVDQFEHLVYLFGYLPTAAKYQACVLPVEGEPHMIVRGMDFPVFSRFSWVSSRRVFADAEDPVAVLAAELLTKFRQAGRVGMEFDSHLLTVQRYLDLKKALPHCELVDFSGVLMEIRLIKSAAEIAYLRKAAAIADACMSAAIGSAGGGVNEREAAASAYVVAMRHGADNGRVLLGSSGPVSDALHAPFGSRVLQEGDIFHLEMVPQVRGYSARLMRPVLIGRTESDIPVVFKRLIAIQDAQIAEMAPGRLAVEIDALARTPILSEGLAKEYFNHTGYTLGHHAQPRTSEHTRIFTPVANWTLTPGMVFHMCLAVRGVAIGETILITENGHERLTQTERKLFLR